MPTKVKIKIKDNENLRKQLDSEYEKHTQIELCKYSILLAKHILQIIEFNDINNPIIQYGFNINEKWQKGNATMHEVRQVGFAIHRLAKANENALIQNTLRVVGQAVATGHMKEHAMVASDYAIKVINILSLNNDDAVTAERLWQIECLKAIK